MNGTPRSIKERWLFLFAVLTLAAGKALPSLIDAWDHDLYAAQGGIALGIWLLALFIAHSKTNDGPREGFLWLAVFTLALGSLAEVNAIKHASLAFAITAALPLRLFGWVFLSLALSWIPASGWVLSRFISSGLSGWERPALASVSLLLLIPLTLSHRRPREAPAV